MKYPNYFSIDALNRMSEYRTKHEHLKEILKSPDSFFVPILNQKNLITLKPEVNAVFLKYDDIKGLINNNYIFLGKYKTNYFFALDVIEESSFIIEDSYEFDDLRKIAPILNSEKAAILAYAKSMVYWRQRVMFCGKCGSETLLEDGGHKASCPKCNSLFFPQTDPAIIVIVTNKERCLLARQAGWPSKRYSVIAGFVEPGESLESAVAREVLEETGLKIKNISYHSSQPWPFPGSIMVGFSAEAKTASITLHDKELEDAKWFSREEIIKKVKSKELKLSPGISISFRLIEDWFNSGSKISLREILRSFSEDY